MSTDASWLEDMPGTYDANLGPALFEPYAHHVAGLALERRPHHVLELAAGTGIGTAALVRALPDAAITATDLNGSMVAWAATRVPAATWQQADAQHLDLPNEAFDLVVCLFGVMFFPDKPGAYAEMARVLRPGGTALLTIWDTVEGSPLSATMVECLKALLPEDPPTFIVRTPHGYTDPDQIRTDVTAGGLEVESLERVSLRGKAISARSFAEGFCLGSPLRFALQERGSLTELTKALGDDMTARLGEGPLDSDLAAFVIAARRP